MNSTLLSKSLKSRKSTSRAPPASRTLSHIHIEPAEDEFVVDHIFYSIGRLILSEIEQGVRQTVYDGRRTMYYLKIRRRWRSERRWQAEPAHVRWTIAMLASFAHRKRVGNGMNKPGENFIGTRKKKLDYRAYMC